MRRALRLALAAAGAAICTIMALRAWGSNSCPVPRLVLAELVVLGIVGLLVAARDTADAHARWRTAAWVIPGALVCAAIITVWSIGLSVLLAATAFAAANLLSSGRRRRLAHATTLFAAAALNFSLLFPIAKRSGIDVVAVPAGSLAMEALDRVDYADAYRGRLAPGAGADLDSVTWTVLASLLPCSLRESANPASIERWNAARKDYTFQPGTRIPMLGWNAYSRTAHEVLIGLDEGHLDFRVAILLSEEGSARSLTVTTVVHYNNWKGRAYFLPVQVGHQIIVPHAVRTAVRNIR